MPATVPLDLKDYVATISDYPAAGVVFRDITPLLADPQSFHYALDQLVAWAEPLRVEAVAGVESRGFILGAALAARLECGFVPIRKRGKLPRSRIGTRVDSEYSTEILELHEDAITPGSRVLFHDDVIALGNCSRGSINLLEQLGGNVVGACFLIEIAALGGRRLIDEYPLLSLIQYS